jgi:hypothetical protein
MDGISAPRSDRPRVLKLGRFDIYWRKLSEKKVALSDWINIQISGIDSPVNTWVNVTYALH